ncbi:hypothetical protein [Stenomitos frigidus]|uniref:Lipoprotein n=1 Tax=Stenomitos frigidus ULC18 TaxID=2107698 RepID=A0A2T1E2J2_9CYAN|nr:hypothetical protein [Stenomitos frigidus]PSB26947.1 hypothetical protein C7B82_17450 [Stenomitos frigidus ULC18]
MSNVNRLVTIALVSVMVGCAKTPQAPPQAQTSPATFSVTAPIKKAKQTAVDVRQKGLEHEQLDPQAQPDQSPDPSK